MTVAKDPDDGPSGSRLTKASRIAGIAASLVTASATTAGVLLIAPPLYLMVTGVVLSLLLWLVLAGALVL